MRLANTKTVTAEIGFKKVHYRNEPSILIAIDNRIDRQQIAIEIAKQVFTSGDTVKEILVKSFTRTLIKYYLKPEINNRFSTSEFWELLSQFDNKVKELKIELTRENLAAIYENISEELLKYGDLTNSHKIILTQQAPGVGVLENLNQQNEQLNNFVEGSSKGTGAISLKIQGQRKKFTTKDKNLLKTVEIETDNIEVEGLTFEQTKEIMDRIYKDV